MTAVAVGTRTQTLGFMCHTRAVPQPYKPFPIQLIPTSPFWGLVLHQLGPGEVPLPVWG